jgi:hypothetical protein
MTSTIQTSQKAQKGNLQKFYSFYLSASLIILGGLVLLLSASLLSIIHVETEIAIVVSLVLLLIFTSLSFVLRSRNKSHRLEMPSYISARGLKFIRYAIIVFFGLVFAYGMLTYPYMPISSNGGIFIDKVGQQYSYEEFLIFKKWELALVSSWGFVLLQGAMFLPFLDRRVKKQRKL